MLKRYWYLILVGMTVLSILSASAYAIYYTWTLGDNEDDYNIVCIGGHEYYRANFANKGFLGIRLSDDGDPVKCEIKQDKE